MAMTINKTLSYAGCCRMVKAIPNAKTAEDMYHRCGVADQWIKCNIVLSDDEYHRLLDAIYMLAEKAEQKMRSHS